MKKLYEFQNKIITLLEKLDNWWEKKAKPQIIRIDKPPEYLENRIVFCSNCQTNQTLWRYQGLLVCSTCCSDNWEFPITVRIKVDEDILKKVLKPSGKC